MSTGRRTPAAERAALILQLVPYLIERGEVSVAQAAADFDVTPQQMRGMVEKLTVIGRPGDSGFWQLPHDLFDIDWDLLEEHDRIALTQTVGLEHAPRLTAREAAALLAGLHLAASFPGIRDSPALPGLLATLARGASGAPAEVIVAPAPVDEVRERVTEALRGGVAVSFTYRTPEGVATTRTVDPVTVHIADGQWYLQGWCHLRQAMRTFHLDRVADVAVTDVAATHSAAPATALFDPDRAEIVARIRFPASHAPLLADYLLQAEVTESGGVCTAELRIADERGLRRLVARFGGDLEVLSPPVARTAAAEWAAAGLAQYGRA
ncbi:MAG: WYL domain-containing protein [Microbacterium sp.]